MQRSQSVAGLPNTANIAGAAFIAGQEGVHGILKLDRSGCGLLARNPITDNFIEQNMVWLQLLESRCRLGKLRDTQCRHAESPVVLEPDALFFAEVQGMLLCIEEKAPAFSTGGDSR